MANQIPSVSWYQTPRNVYLEFLLPDSKNVIVDYETDPEKGECSTLLFEADANQKHYLICVELFAPIVEEESTHLRMENKIKVMLKKKREDEEWSRIPKQKDQYKNAFKVDWSKMEDDEPEEDADMERMMKQMQMQQMMQQMGGGMPGEPRYEGGWEQMFEKIKERQDPNFVDHIPGDEEEDEEYVGSDDEEIDTSNFSPEDHARMQAMAQQVQGDDGEIDMARFEEVMKGMKMEDFQGLMSKLSPEQIKDMIGEEEEE